MTPDITVVAEYLRSATVKLEDTLSSLEVEYRENLSTPHDDNDADELYACICQIPKPRHIYLRPSATGCAQVGYKFGYQNDYVTGDDVRTALITMILVGILAEQGWGAEFSIDVLDEAHNKGFSFSDDGDEISGVPAIAVQTELRNRNPNILPEGNYVEKTKRLLEARMPELYGKVSHADIYHDGWCASYAGLACNCDPDVQIRKEL
jgi:hypothetical protein